MIDLILKNSEMRPYSDGTPPVAYNYDQTAALGVTLTNTTGQFPAVEYPASRDL
jgi:hypothetical protein